MAEREVANLTDAIASGALRGSPAIAGRLRQAEEDLARLQAEAARPSAMSTVERLVVNLDERIERAIKNSSTSCATLTQRAAGWRYATCWAS